MDVHKMVVPLSRRVEVEYLPGNCTGMEHKTGDVVHSSASQMSISITWHGNIASSIAGFSHVSKSFNFRIKM